MRTAVRAPSPSKTRKARTVGAVQAPTNFLYSSTDEDNLIGQQAQRLVRLFGLPDSRARTIAALAWGGAHG